MQKKSSILASGITSQKIKLKPKVPKGDTNEGNFETTKKKGFN